MTILEVIKNDHDRIKALCNRLMNNIDSDPEKRSEIIRHIRMELVPHSRAEEVVLYNKMRSSDGPNGQIYDGFREHAEAEALLYALEAVESVHVDYKMIAQKLTDTILHHIQEEEDVVFQEAKALFSKKEGEEMAKEFNILKPKIRDQSPLISSVEFLQNLIPPQMTELVKSKMAELIPRQLH